MIKIYQMNDYDWIAARSADEALEFYKREVMDGEEDIEEYLDEDAPRELSDEDLDRYQHSGEDGERKTPITFREELEISIAEGVKFPCLFATTEM